MKGEFVNAAEREAAASTQTNMVVRQHTTVHNKRTHLPAEEEAGAA